MHSPTQDPLKSHYRYVNAECAQFQHEWFTPCQAFQTEVLLIPTI